MIIINIIFIIILTLLLFHFFIVFHRCNIEEDNDGYDDDDIDVVNRLY